MQENKRCHKCGGIHKNETPEYIKKALLWAFLSSPLCKQTVQGHFGQFAEWQELLQLDDPDMQSFVGLCFVQDWEEARQVIKKATQIPTKYTSLYLSLQASMQDTTERINGIKQQAIPEQLTQHLIQQTLSQLQDSLSQITNDFLNQQPEELQA